MDWVELPASAVGEWPASPEVEQSGAHVAEEVCFAEQPTRSAGAGLE